MYNYHSFLAFVSYRRYSDCNGEVISNDGAILLDSIHISNTSATLRWKYSNRNDDTRIRINPVVCYNGNEKPTVCTIKGTDTKGLRSEVQSETEYFALDPCLFVLRFYGPVNPIRSCQARSVLPNHMCTGHA